MTKRYKVYTKHDIWWEYENPEYGSGSEWVYEGTTTAVSEKQAINNIRFRKYGNVSQHKPLSVGNSYAEFIFWKAEEE